MLIIYGKKGLSRHGAAVYYLKPGTKKEYLAPGEFSILFLDQITENETIQDLCSVAAMTEAMLGRVKKAPTQVTEVEFQTDNTECYNNHNLPVMLPFLCHPAGFDIISYFAVRLVMVKVPVMLISPSQCSGYVISIDWATT